MRRLAAAALLLLPLAAAGAERSWSFRVLLDEREIGRNDFVLKEGELVSEARFDVRLLFVSVLRYTHRALERWQGNCLAGLTAHTEINGAVERVSDHLRIHFTEEERVTSIDWDLARRTVALHSPPRDARSKR